jgi:hypothetical protein
VTLVAGLAIFLVPVATAASASAQMSVTAQPNKTLVQTDTSFHITGSVLNATAPLVVRLQASVDKGWSNVGSRHTSAAGVYSISLKENHVGTDTFRVAVYQTAAAPLPTTVPLGVSPTFKVTIASWTYLSTWKPMNRGGQTGQVEINGVTYCSSVYYNDANGAGHRYTEYALKRHCYELTGVLGLNDLDYAGTYGEFMVLTDSKTVLDATVRVGQARPMDLHVAGVLVLHLGWTFSDPYHRYTMAYGNARVFCSF